MLYKLENNQICTQMKNLNGSNITDTNVIKDYEMEIT